jgi:hypothetical protein
MQINMMIMTDAQTNFFYVMSNKVNAGYLPGWILGRPRGMDNWPHQMAGSHHLLHAEKKIRDLSNQQICALRR